MKWAPVIAAALSCCVRADVQKPTAPAVQETVLSNTGRPQQTELEKRVTDLNALAVEKGKAGDYQAAVAFLEQARSICAPPAVVSPGFYANVLANLADSYEQLGAWDQAIKLLREAASREEQTWGPSNPRTARMQVRLASAEVVVGEFSNAEPLLSHAVEVQRSAPPANQFELAMTLTAMALLNLNLNRPDEAERQAAEAVGIAETLHIENADYASMLGVLGGAYTVQGERSRALPLLNRSIEVLQKTLSPDHNRVAPVLIQRGLIEAAEHKYALAEADMQHAIGILDKTGGGPGANGDWARFRLARVYMDEHKLAEADQVLSPALERQRQFFAGAANVRLAFYVRELARLRAMEKRYNEATALYREAIAMATAIPTPGTTATVPTRESAANFSNNRPAREKDVRRLEQRANEVFGFRTAE